MNNLPPALKDLVPCYAEGYAEDAYNCTRFYRCVDYGTPEKPILLRHDFSCGPGTIFDATISVCNHPHHVKGSPGCQTQYTYVGQRPRVISSSNNQNNANGGDIVFDQYLDDDDGSLNSPRADALIQSRIGTPEKRSWPVNYVKAIGPVVHYQVQVPYA